jgi:hypothetical protein
MWLVITISVLTTSLGVFGGLQVAGLM